MFHRLAFLFNRLAFPCQKMEEIIISSKKQKAKKTTTLEQFRFENE